MCYCCVGTVVLQSRSWWLTNQPNQNQNQNQFQFQNENRNQVENSHRSWAVCGQTQDGELNLQCTR